MVFMIFLSDTIQLFELMKNANNIIFDNFFLLIENSSQIYYSCFFS